ncbi:PIR protein, putative [Plasmodium sp.]|nr:PIR protein, putative [Plasmodium sp.]
MKLQYNNILLFALPLNILSHNKNKTYITPHTTTTTSRGLSECEIQTSIYDKDPDMKAVKENFDRQTSHRFEKYEERMSKKRQKCKEQCDKDIQKIIVKDKIDKSLSEKMEKGCLMCGCGLGGVAAAVGLIGAVAVSELKKAAMAKAAAAAVEEGAAAGLKAGEAAGVSKVIELIKSKFRVSTLFGEELGSIFNATNYTKETVISHAVFSEYQKSSCMALGTLSSTEKPICTAVQELGLVQGHVEGNGLLSKQVIDMTVKGIVSNAKIAADTKVGDVTVVETYTLKLKNIAAVQSEFNIYITSIYASVIAILIIVLIMVIIYLILRYRRKKKMKKKQQYIKLLKK